MSANRGNMGLWSCGILVLLALQVLPAAHRAEVSPAVAYLEKNNDKFGQMLKAVSVDDKALAAMNGVLLAPSDAAVDSMAASMGMTTKELLGKPLLVDRITSYHFMPAIKVTKGEKMVNMPLITKTADKDFVVRFYKDAKTNRAWLLDMQGNKVPLKQQPVVFGNLTVVPVDKVLMSGNYFKNFEDALKLHPQLGKASELFKRAAVSNTAGIADTTMFVPVDKAFESSKVSVSTLSQPESLRVLQYHAAAPAKPISQLQPGTRATLLSGHDVKVDITYSGDVKAPWSDKTIKRPVVIVTDEAGNKANVTLFNIWAGKGAIQGISSVLQPRSAAVRTQAGQDKPTASTGGPSKASSAGGSRRLLHQSGASRRLLQAGGQVGPDWSQPNPASALLDQNTVQAAYAAHAAYENAYYGMPDSPGWAHRNLWYSWETNG